MFVNVSPEGRHVKESVNSMVFASRAKTIALGKATKNREKVGVGTAASGGCWSTLISRMQCQVQSKIVEVTATMSAINKLQQGEADGARPEGSGRRKKK